MIISPSTTRGYLQAVSGLFISSSNPSGITPRELDILTAILFVLREEKETSISAEVKHKVSQLTNHPIQVITNYVKKLRDKKVLDQNNKLHPLITGNEITIKKSKDNL